MAQVNYQAAGDAQEEKFISAPNPVGLYQNKFNGTLVGVIDPIQGDAVIRNGFELVEEGREAAMLPQKELDKRQKQWVKENDPAAKDTEIADLQRQLDEANARLAESQNNDQTNTENIRASSDQSDTAADQAALVPERNIKAPIERTASPTPPTGADLKAAQEAKKEATQPTQTAEEQLKMAGALDDSGTAAKQAEEDDARTTGVDENATLKPADNAGEQLSGVFQSSDQSESAADKASTPAPKNDGNPASAKKENS